MKGEISMEFFFGGSISGNNYGIRIAKGILKYKETAGGGNKRLKAFERKLADDKIAQIISAVKASGIMDARNQDFSRHPMVPDEAYYTITMSLGRKKIAIECGQGQPDGQKAADELRQALNRILRLDIK